MPAWVSGSEMGSQIWCLCRLVGLKVDDRTDGSVGEWVLEWDDRSGGSVG